MSSLNWKTLAYNNTIQELVEIFHVRFSVLLYYMHYEIK